MENRFSWRETKVGKNSIGMDTGNHKEWLHFWVGKHEYVKVKGLKNKKKVFISQSLRLDREEARALIEEIEDRLF